MPTDEHTGLPNFMIVCVTIFCSYDRQSLVSFVLFTIHLARFYDWFSLFMLLNVFIYFGNADITV